MHALSLENVFRPDRRLSGRRRSAAGVRPRLRPARAPHRRAAPERHALSHRRRRLALQVHRGRLRVPVRQAREEDRRRRGRRGHAGRLGRAEVRRAQALSRRARAAHASARERLRPRAQDGGADGDRAAAGLLGLAGAPGRGPREPGQDGGRQARLERAARTVAVLRGLGYAGAYLGGTHDATQITWIIRRADELAPQWEALAAELGYGAAAGFYIPARKPSRDQAGAAKSRVDRLSRVLDWLGARVSGRSRYLSFAERSLVCSRGRIAESRSPRLVERVELAIKKPLFGCQACGNCVLGHLEYVCPQTCPKQLRNGPCGGTDQGRCEVTPEKPCIWVAVYDRAKSRERRSTRSRPTCRPRSPAARYELVDQLFLDRDSRPCRRAALIPAFAWFRRSLGHQGPTS